MTEADFESDELRWAALMVSAQVGHESDYRVLLTEMSEVINRYLRSRFGHHHFIEDCVQETLVAIHQARHTYDSRRPFRPWMFAIVRYKAIDTLRRQRSHQNTLERHRQNLEVNAQVTGSDHPENGMVRGRLLESLSPQYREAITLTKINGLSIAEAARQLSISEGALKVRVHRAMGRLKRMVQAGD
jgi:RNA polymerase sigma-70 factor (ECF subfamily)